MRIAVLDDYQDVFRTLDAAKRLAGHEVVTFSRALRGDALCAALDGFDAVVLTQQRTALPREAVERLPASLRFVAQTGRSTGHLDLDALAQRDVKVLTAGLGDPAAPAELTWALILASRRHVVQEANALRSGRWQVGLGSTLQGKTLGVWAFGRIGSRVAEVGRAFGMRVVCHGRAGSLDRAKAAGFEVMPDRAAFFGACDVVSVHLPLTPGTRGLVRAQDLAAMREDALFVNTSRAGLLEPGALLDALSRGRPGFAAVDVFDEEPTPADEPLLSLPNVLATPHLGYVTRESHEAYFGATLEALAAALG
jgi:D-3-phosphoglycerate dehydrogenase